MNYINISDMERNLMIDKYVICKHNGVNVYHTESGGIWHWDDDNTISIPGWNPYHRPFPIQNKEPMKTVA